jgi:hypothetical protein
MNTPRTTVLLHPAGEPDIKPDGASVPCELVIRNPQTQDHSQAVTVFLHNMGGRWLIDRLTNR